MKHSIPSFESEIVHQILISELCFKLCDSIVGLPGLGNHFLPFFHNLNYQRGIDSLYSLLLYKGDNELSIKNYIKLYREIKPDENMDQFEQQIKEIINDFEQINYYSIRNKVGSHFDGNFTHKDFTSGYLLDGTVKPIITIIKKLKILFFTKTNYSLENDPLKELRAQCDKIIIEFFKDSVDKYFGKLRN